MAQESETLIKVHEDQSGVCRRSEDQALHPPPSVMPRMDDKKDFNDRINVYTNSRWKKAKKNIM